MNPENLTPEELAKLRKILNSDGSTAEAPKEQSEKSSPKEQKSPKPKGPRKSWYKNKVILTGLAFVVTIALAAIYVFAVEPWLSLKQAENALKEEVSQSAVIVGNGEMLSYTPENEEDVLAGANPKQLALGSDGEVTPPSYFEFRSENSNADSHILDLYIDFYSQRSRDLISLNQATLASFIGTGEIILRVHPVVDTAGFSVFAPEALAEVFGTHPDLAWEFFVSLMRNSDSLLSNANTETAKEPTSQEIVQFIADISKSVGVATGSPNGVDADSIKYLTFFSWMYAGGRDPKLEVGYYPPVLYIDGEEIDQEEWILTDPDSMLRLLSSLE